MNFALTGAAIITFYTDNTWGAYCQPNRKFYNTQANKGYLRRQTCAACGIIDALRVFIETDLVVLWKSREHTRRKLIKTNETGDDKGSV